MSKSNVKSRVKELLQQDISLADNDNALIYDYFLTYVPHSVSYEFINWFLENNKTCNQISRSRRKIEEQCSELRVNGYNKRHHILEPKFRQMVKNNEL